MSIVQKITAEQERSKFMKALGELSDLKISSDNVMQMLEQSDYPKKIVKRCKEKIKELSDAE